MALKQDADVFHFHDPELIFVGALLKLLTRKKVFYDVHENVPKQILNKEWIKPWLRKLLSGVYRLGERMTLPFIDKIIIAEDSYWDNYANFKEKVVAVKNYPLLSYSKTAPLDEAKGNGPVRLIYVGRLSKIRGIMEILEALLILVNEKKHDNLVLDVIGTGSDELLKEITTFIDTHELGRLVNLHGQMPHDEVYSYLYKSNIGLAILHPDPNYVESLPTKMFEYMSTKLPVIASDFPLWAGILKNSKCGITVDPLDPNKIADAIEYLLNNHGICVKMGENGRRAVEEKFSWEVEQGRLLTVYKELLGDK